VCTVKTNGHDEFCHCDDCLGTFTTLGGKTYTVEEIAAMPMEEYAQHREDLLRSIRNPAVEAEMLAAVQRILDEEVDEG